MLYEVITRFQVRLKTGLMEREPLIHSGVATERLSGEKMERTACWRMRLTPKVAKSVSRGRPYRKRMMERSMRMPTSPETMNAAGMATMSEAPMLSGSYNFV